VASQEGSYAALRTLFVRDGYFTPVPNEITAHDLNGADYGSSKSMPPFFLESIANAFARKWKQPSRISRTVARSGCDHTGCGMMDVGQMR
jgi:hypothetical protein